MEAALRAIAEPRRRRILQLVSDEELSAGEIASHFDVSRPAISQHLTVLKGAGLVTSGAKAPAASTSSAMKAWMRSANFSMSSGPADSSGSDWPPSKKKGSGNEHRRSSEQRRARSPDQGQPGDIFPFFTEPDLMVRWMGTAAELDARPGGAHRVEITGERVATGEYLEVSPHDRVVFTWGWKPMRRLSAPVRRR